MVSSMLLLTSSIASAFLAAASPFVDVSLSGVSCCGDPTEVTESANLTNHSFPCCYPDAFEYTLNIGPITTNGSSSATVLDLTCPSTATATFLLPGGGSYSPSIESFCGVDEFMSAESLPDDLNVNVSVFASVAIGAISTNGSIVPPNIECMCSLSYSDAQFSCSSNIAAPLCAVPDGISGFVDFTNMTTDTASECGCDFTFSFLDWSLVVGSDGDVAFDYWADIDWVGGYSAVSSDDDLCLDVTATVCEDNGCEFDGSEVDSASSSFETAGYFDVGGAQSGCWCFAMNDVCVSTADPSTSSVTSDPTTDPTADPTTELDGDTSGIDAIGALGWLIVLVGFTL